MLELAISCSDSLKYFKDRPNTYNVENKSNIPISRLAISSLFRVSRSRLFVQRLPLYYLFYFVMAEFYQIREIMR